MCRWDFRGVSAFCPRPNSPFCFVGSLWFSVSLYNCLLWKNHMQMKEEAERKKQSLHPSSWVSADKGSFFCDVGVLVAQVGMCPHHESRCSLSALRFWEFIKCQFILSKDIPRKVLKTTLERNGAGVGDVRSPESLFTRVIRCFNPFVHEPWQLGAFLASCGCDCSRLAFGT